MCESLYLQRQSERFLAAHPCEAGWAVHQIHGDSGREMSLNYLLGCLREWHPAAITCRLAFPLVAAGGFRDWPHTRTLSNSDVLNGDSEEVDAYSWRGTIELIWNGHDIHCHKLSLAVGNGLEELYLVATKSVAAFRDLLLILNRYSKAKHKGKTEEIYVINGKDIPVTVHSWDDLVLPDTMARDIQANVAGFFAGRERYLALGIPHRRGFLFVGPPGCGKTLTLKTLASNTPAKFISVLGTADVSDATLCMALERAEECTPAVVLLEDLNRIVQAKGVSMSHFLNLLDGLKSLNGVLVIATCNEPDKLDPALIHRPSRFDRVWRFDLPRYEQRLELLRRKGGKCFSDSALETAARWSEGFSIAYVQEIVVNALLECAHDELDPTDDHLHKSFDTLHIQRKEVSKPGESIEKREVVGFCASDNGSR